MRKRLVAFLTVLLLAFAGSSTAIAAPLTLVSKELSPEKTWNPWPEKDDLELPMPCDGKMVLRAVEIPVKGFLYDKKVVMGINDTKDADRNLYERRYDGHISAPFTPTDLPAAWQKVLETKNKDNAYYYFIAKYEISDWQWRAVMDSSCPKAPLSADAAAPKTDLTWLDIQNFLFKYMDWLLQNHKATLPLFADNDKDLAYLRLPTEAEWEFAARGGSRVPEEHRNQEDFFPLQNYSPAAAGSDAELKIGDFAVYRSADSNVAKLQPIGSRKPNPLLIYDMPGNARELVQSHFQFTITEQNGAATVRRLHGSSGGLVSKGGSFMTDEAGILPGSRVEVPIFQERGPYSARDLSFRPVLTGINTPASASRLERLEAENTTMSSIAQTASAQTPTPVPPTPASDPAPPAPAPPTPASDPAPPAPAPTPIPPAPLAEQPKDQPVRLDPLGNLLVELDKITLAAASPEMKNNLYQYRAMVADKASATERQREEVVLGVMRSALYQAEGFRNNAFRILRAERDLDSALEELVNKLKKFTKKTPEGDKANEDMERGKARAKVIKADMVASLLSSSNNYKQDVEFLSKESPDVIKRNFELLRTEYAGGDLMATHMRENMNALEKHVAQTRQKSISSLAKEQIWVDIIPKQLLQSDTLGKLLGKKG